jgi:hypothetical protein
MPTNTPNYNLPKPLGTENFTRINHNQLIDAIDTNIKNAMDLKETPAGAQAKVDAAIAALINGSPGALDTLNELAQAMGDDPNFATTVLNRISTDEQALTTHKADGAIDAHNASNISVADATGLFTSNDVEGALKEAIEKANSAFTSASNGKIQVRDAITGKGGTVADNDGDGIPTFQELTDGVSSISQGGMELPNGTTFSNFGVHVHAVDEDGNYYMTKYNSTSGVYEGKVYSPNMTLLATYTDALGRSIAGISPDGYISTVNNSEVDVYNLSGTLLANVPMNRIAQDYPTLRGTHIAFFAPFDNIFKVVNFSGTALFSYGQSQRPPFLVNKKNNLIFIRLSSNMPNGVYRFDEAMNQVFISGVQFNHVCLDYQNW